MSNIFLYGPLCWTDLLDRVVGHADYDIAAATLPDHQVVVAKGKIFPMIQKAQGQAEGLLLRDVPGDVLARLDHYISSFGYMPDPVEVQSNNDAVPAYAYFPSTDWQGGEPWDFSAWQKDHGPLTLEAALEVMHRFGLDSPAQIARTYPMMQVRGCTRLNAKAQPSPASSSGLTIADVKLVDYRLPYLNYFATAEVDIKVPGFAGGFSETVTRAALLATDAAIVLPYDPVRDRVLMIEQFRMGPYLRSDPNPWMMEPVAGRVDAGEHPDTTARREAVEEAGLTITDLHHVHSGYASPGDSTEYFHVYVGITDLPDGCARLGGLEEEAEDIKGHLAEWDDFYTRLTTGQLPVTPLALAGYWLAHNRGNLRKAG